MVLLLSAIAVGVAAPKGLGRSLAIAFHQIAYGLVLIGGCSLGLASLGLAAVYGQKRLENSLLGAGVVQRVSLFSALATVCIGLGLTTVALMG